MRFLLITLLIAGTGLLLDDGEKDGRRGNELYEQGSYGPAVESYRSGLAALDEDAAMRLRYGLQNNLGAALLKSEDAEAAAEVFSRALAAAPTTADIARTTYNAGNAAYSAEDLESSLAYYRQSLLSEPDNQDAKFNYEFVKRRLQQQQQQQQQQDGDDSEQENQDQNQSQGDQEQDQQQSDREDEQRQDSEDEQQQDRGNEQQQGDQPNEEQAEQQPQSSEAGEKLSEEQAQRILQALQNEEEQLLREVQRKDARPRRVEKDW